MNPQTGESNFRSAYYPGTPTLEGAQRLKATAGAETSGVRYSVGTQSTYTITGSVIDTTDSPGQRRYMVTAMHTSEGGAFAVSNQATNHSTFTIRGVPSGEYLLTARSLLVGSAVQTAGPNSTVQIAQRQNKSERRR